MIFIKKNVNASIRKDYFNWIYDILCKDLSPEITVKDLLSYLHETEFIVLLRQDRDRYSDGIDLRYRFALENDYESHVEDILGILDGPCSVLEMMTALALRLEETIMDNPSYGDRTSQWFWGMISNLGLNGQWNDNFDEDYVCTVVNRFLNREYESNGKGGLFTVRGETEDLRDVEIWYQANWYLAQIT